MTKKEREEKMATRLVEMKEIEGGLHEKGILYVAGVDEAGRGPLAGPVVAAAAVLPPDFGVLGVDDSKKLTPKKRAALYDEIRNTALAYGIGIRDNHRIDEINILEATKEAMAEAVANAEQMLQKKIAKGQLPPCPSSGGGLGYVLFDAMKIDSVKIPQESLIKGDARALCIAAASILAKVTRDRMMEEYAKQYPDYGFESNMGYGTAAHYEGIRKAGISPIHRMSFLKNLDEHLKK